MKFRLQRSDLVAIGLALAVIIFVTLLPSPKDNNPPLPPDSKHRVLKIEKDCLACHVQGGERPLKERHPKRQDCFRCHRVGGTSDAVLFLISSAQAQSRIPRPDHLVVVIEENRSYAEIIGNADDPYINSLAQQGALFTQSFAVTYPSQPNYLFLFSGWSPDTIGDTCNNDKPHRFSAPNLGSALIGAGLTFKGYSEGLPAVGFTGCSSGNYYRRHNPWVNWQGASAHEVPAAANLPFADFPTDFSKLPTVSIVVPTLKNNMHDGSIRRADRWLEANLKTYVEWAKANSSLLIVTWDEDDSKHGNHIPTIFVGPMVRPGRYGGRITHSNVLRTIEDMYGLPYAGNSATAAPIVEVWAQTTVP